MSDKTESQFKVGDVVTLDSAPIFATGHMVFCKVGDVGTIIEIDDPKAYTVQFEGVTVSGLLGRCLQLVERHSE